MWTNFSYIKKMGTSFSTNGKERKVYINTHTHTHITHMVQKTIAHVLLLLAA